MNRLQSELSRLYLPLPCTPAQTDAGRSPLIDPSDKVRAMVMELRSPPGWDALSQVWHGVQAELALPAPAIAVSGIDAVQLWFSLAEPVAVTRAHAFLERMAHRFLADTEAGRVRLMPGTGASSLRPDLHAALVPALQTGTGNWSAFLAPDLVPIFADTPWLDIPPNQEGQASLLRGIAVMKMPAFEAAFEKLVPGAPEGQPIAANATRGSDPLAPERTAPEDAVAHAERFLLQIMNDATVALALRIEAAKALLHHTGVSR